MVFVGFLGCGKFIILWLVVGFLELMIGDVLVGGCEVKVKVLWLGMVF